MDGNLVLELSAIFVLVLANGFFALAEISVVASRLSRLKQKVAQKKVGARSATRLHQEPENFLASVQVGITLVGAMLGVFSGATLVDRFNAWLVSLNQPWLTNSATAISMAAVVLFITVLSVVIGELVPKFIALSHPERYARLSAGPMTVFVKITAVFSQMLSFAARSVVRLLGIKRNKAQDSVTEEEIEQMLIDGRKEGVFDATEEEFVRSVFEFSEATVRRAMKPRTDVVGIERFAEPDEVRKIILEDGYSRYPIFEGDLDNIVGLIYTKDFLQRNGDTEQFSLTGIIREAWFVPDSMPLPRLLTEFQKGKNHMAIVLDEFGGTAGIITLEDVLEELVGEIQDEYDREAAPLAKQSETVCYADAEVWPGEVNELIGTLLPEDDIDTLSGLFMEEAGHLPVKNESIVIGDARLTILSLSGNRIVRMKIENLRPQTAMD